MMKIRRSLIHMVVGIAFTKLNAVYVGNGTTDLKRNGLLNVNDAKKSIDIYWVKSNLKANYALKGQRHRDFRPRLLLKKSISKPF